MEPLVDQRLGEIESGDPGVFQKAVVEQDLVHAGAGEGEAQRVGELDPQIVGVEDGVLRDLAKPVGAMAHHVGQCPDEHAHLAVKAFDPADRARRRALGMLDEIEPAGAVHDPRHRCIGCQLGGQRDRAAAWPAAAMRGREGLVQIEVQCVDAELGGQHPPDDRVEIGTVAIEERAGAMHRGGDVEDLVLEQAAGVGVGQHQRGDIAAELRLQRGQIDPAARIGRDRLDAIAAGRRRRRVGAMRRFRHQDMAAPVAARLQCGANCHDAAQFAMRAGGRRQGHRRHAGQRLQPMRQRVDQLERALHRRYRLQRVQIGETRQPRHLLVEPRVVLHRARAERVEAAVDRVILLRQAGEMAHHLRLAEAGQADRRLAVEAA